MTPSDIAEIIRVIPDTIRKWYRGDYLPSLYNWHKLNQFYTETKANAQNNS